MAGREAVKPAFSLVRLTASLAPAGLNLIGVADVAAWDAAAPERHRSAVVAPGARSIVVVANGGRAAWSAFVADLERDAAVLVGHRHPFDAWCAARVRAADDDAGGARAWFFAAAESEIHLDFRRLAALAGLGVRSRLGLLLHPEFGPWVGLRAAAFVDEVLPVVPPPRAVPCDTCARPCVEACPGAAFPDGAWNVDACTAFHVVSTACARTCHARVACPEGAAHRYGDEQLGYHYDRLGGRRALRRRAPAAPDPYEGDGPHWADWRARVR